MTECKNKALWKRAFAKKEIKLLKKAFAKFNKKPGTFIKNKILCGKIYIKILSRSIMVSKITKIMQIN